MPTIPPGLLPGRIRRAVPYLYSDEDLAALLRQTETLQTTLRAATMRALIGLFAVTGIRLSEALAADDADFDVDAGVLLVRHGKFGKQRLLPLHPSTVEALTASRTIRDEWFPIPVSPALLVSQAGTRLFVSGVELTFTRLARRVGLTPRTPACRPRIHDLRHTFAVRTLLGWYRDGGDIDARMPLLSTYLGHVSPQEHVLVPRRRARTDGRGRPSTPTAVAGAIMTIIVTTVQAFFTDRLISQRQASPHTVAAYRDTVRMLLQFAGTRASKNAVQAGLRRPERDGRRRVPGPSGARPRITASVAATPASPRSTPCSPSPRCSTLNTAAISPESWRSRPSEP